MTAGPGSISRAPYAARLALALAAEGGYLTARTLIFGKYIDPIEREIAITLARLASALVLLFLFPELLRRDPARRGLPRHPLLLAVLAADFLAMPLAGLVMGYQPSLSLVYAATAPVVGLREEVFYRGILQGALDRVAGPVLGIAGASILFALSHIGAQPIDAYSVTQFLAAGVLLGVIYHRTRNLLLVAGLHAAYDMVVVLVPRIQAIGPGTALLANMVIIFGAVVWAKMDAERRQAP